MLRRRKRSSRTWPPRETLLKVELMPAQKRVYRAILDRAVEHIKNPRSSLRNVFMQLRAACDHSMLLEAGAAEEAAVEDALARLQTRPCAPPPEEAAAAARRRARGRRASRRG